MKRLIGGFFIVGLLAMMITSFRASPDTYAQDGTAAGQASAIADLQTRVAALETAAADDAGGSGESDAGTDFDQWTGRGATPVSGTGSVLFEANTQTGFSDWTEGYFGGFSNQFITRDGMLVAEAGYWTVLYAPYLTTSPDYILEVEMRQPPPGAGTPEPTMGGTIAGLAARYWNASWDDQGGYTAATYGQTARFDTPGDEVVNAPALLPDAINPDPTDHEWHTYRLEVRGDQIRFLVDGVLMAKATGVQYQGIGAEGRVGVLVSLGPVEIRAFRVIAWE